MYEKIERLMQASRGIANTINTLELGGTSVAHEEIKKP